MKKPTVEIVLVNCLRPDNVALIVPALKRQDYDGPFSLTVCQAPPAPDLPAETLALCDTVHFLSKNNLCLNRYVRSSMYHEDYTLILDDDMLPGSGMVRHFVDAALRNPDGALFGQLGRIVSTKKGYEGIDYPRSRISDINVESVVCAYFLKTSYLSAFWQFYELVKDYEEVNSMDDFVLAWGIHTFSNGKIYLTRNTGNPEELVCKEWLPQPHALWALPGRAELRKRFWKRCSELSLRHKKII